MAMNRQHHFARGMNFSFVALLSLALAGAGQGNDDGFPSPADLPAQSGLPDPLIMLDGRKVTNREMWVKERRPELIRLFQHYMYGRLPPRPKAVSGIVARVDVSAFGGKATLSEVTIRFGPPEVPPIHLLLVVPNRRTAPAPVVLGMNYFGNHTLLHDRRVRLADNWMPERGEGVVENRATEASRGTRAEIWRIEEMIDRGYAVATFYNGDVDPDTPDRRGLQRFFPVADSADACGTIGAWAWGLQRAVDYLRVGARCRSSSHRGDGSFASGQGGARRGRFRRTDRAGHPAPGRLRRLGPEPRCASRSANPGTLWTRRNRDGPRR